eukprot:g19756.t1
MVCQFRTGPRDCWTFRCTVQEASGLRRSNSEPALCKVDDSLPCDLGLKEGLDRHETGTCKPCSFFFFKEDGCRRGSSCKFCHFCSEDTARRQKRNSQRKARAVRRRAVAA